VKSLSTQCDKTVKEAYLKPIEVNNNAEWPKMAEETKEKCAWHEKTSIPGV